MKTSHLLIAVCTALLALYTSCSDTQLPVDHNETPQGTPVTLTAIRKNMEQTRLAHAYDAITKGMGITWTTDDAFMLYGVDNGTREKFTLNGGENTGEANFSGMLPSGANSFNAFYPFSKAENKTWEQCEFNITGQVQNGDGSTAHLSAYNYMTLYNPTEVVAATISSQSLVFRHEVAIFRIEVTLPGKYIPTHLTLETTVDVSAPTKYGFVTVREARNGAMKELNRTVTLELKNIPKTDTFVAYMAMLPSTLKDNITYRVLCDGPTPVVCTLVAPITGSWSYIAGRVYHAEISPDIDMQASPGLFSSSIEGVPWTEGSGNSSADPYQITSAAQLKYLVDQVAGGNNYFGNYFRLDTDIHVTAAEWTPIGSSATMFQGKFNGNNRTISGVLQGNSKYFGFFGQISGAEITNLHISADVRTTSTSALVIGGIVGDCSDSNLIKGCSNSGTISVSNSGSVEYLAGGIAGVFNNGTLDDCSNSGTVALATNGNGYAGGIVGQVMSGGKVIRCDNSGAVSANWLLSDLIICRVGGIVAANFGVLHQNTNAGAASSNANNNSTGGLVGLNRGTVYPCNTSIGNPNTWIHGGNLMEAVDDSSQH